MGRKPDPIEFRTVKGNPQRRPMPKALEVQGVLIEPPDSLTLVQKLEWKYIIAQAPMGLLRSLDKAILTTYVVAWDIHRQAAEKVNHLGIMCLSKNKTPYMNPYLSILNKQASIMIKCCGEMGFTPAARTKLALNEADNHADPLEAFFKKPASNQKAH